MSDRQTVVHLGSNCFNVLAHDAYRLDFDNPLLPVVRISESQKRLGCSLVAIGDQVACPRASALGREKRHSQLVQLTGPLPANHVWCRECYALAATELFVGGGEGQQ